jgi:lipopolysaccharide biosynthesis regulator YciM
MINLYDFIKIHISEEEVDMEEDTYEDGQVEQPKIIWQEAKAKCKDCGELITMGWECPTCDSKNVEEIKPIFFEKWEEADAFAQKYWEKKLAEMKIESTEREG